MEIQEVCSSGVFDCYTIGRQVRGAVSKRVILLYLRICSIDLFLATLFIISVLFSNYEQNSGAVRHLKCRAEGRPDRCVVCLSLLAGRSRATCTHLG